VVATGPAVAPLVGAAGYEHVELVMSRGSNPGVLRTDGARSAEARSMEAFLAATRRGMLQTLRFQAEARATDLLWRPKHVARRAMQVVERIRPDVVLVDHLALAATIGLRALGVSYGDVVLGHHTALPVGSEIYGVPTAWPAAVHAEPIELAALRDLAQRVDRDLSRTYDEVLHSLSAGHPTVPDAFAAHGDVVLYNYPAELHPASRSVLLPRHAFLGSVVRGETPDPEVAAWLGRPDPRPLVVVSFGTFLSARSDLLARVAAALRNVDARVAIAIGSNDRHALGSPPDDWLVRPSVPQVALLGEAALLVSHGGNNSVTEALAQGVPLVVLPISTDQFDGAAAVERHAAGIALDPHRASPALLAGSVRGLLANPPGLPRLLAERMRAAPGPEVAYAAMSRGCAEPVAAADARGGTTEDHRAA
jgi:zeaxanthin glucosyltransferase